MRVTRCDIADDLCASGHSEAAAVAVNENTGDGSWRVRICHPCAAVLNLRTGQDIPENARTLLLAALFREPS